jgi:surfactin synthase thioesterase subunit
MVQRVHLEPWRELTTSDFKLHMLPGDHFFLTGAEPMLLRAIGRQLQNAPSLADVEHNRA